jgi:membrane-bound ClpP family serine protease
MSLIWWIVGIVLIIIFIWISVVKSVAAHKREARGGMESLIGIKGIAKTDINPSGKFYVNGEYWDAEARGEPLKKDDKGRVVAFDQIDEKYLIIEKIKD